MVITGYSVILVIKSGFYTQPNRTRKSHSMNDAQSQLSENAKHIMVLKNKYIHKGVKLGMHAFMPYVYPLSKV